MADEGPCALLMLPTDVLENILARIGDLPLPFRNDAQGAVIGHLIYRRWREDQTASFASCSSLATARVMQCLRCTWALKPSETTDGVIAKLASTARGMGLAPSDLRGGVCVDGLATNVLDYDAVFDMEKRRLRAFPPVLRHAIQSNVIDTVRKLDLSAVGFRRLPEGLSALTELHVTECRELDECWLPESSGRRVRKLRATDSNVARLPESMESLEKLDVSGCKHLDAENHGWLPRSSRRCVRELIMKGSNLTSVPGGMEALETLVASDARIDEHWLPRDSRRQIRALVVHVSKVACVPEDMPELVILRLHDCQGLGSDAWLPPSSSCVLQELVVSRTDLHRLPENLEALEYVDVDECVFLAEDWLPESSARHVTFVLARGSNIRKLPPNMAELAFVDVSFASNLEADFLPESSGRVLSFVNAYRSSMGRLPVNMDHLLFLNVTRCGNFEAAGLPESSRRNLWAFKPGAEAPVEEDLFSRTDSTNVQTILELTAKSAVSVERSPYYLDDFYGESDVPKLPDAMSPFGRLSMHGLYDAWHRLHGLFGSAAPDEAQVAE